jgi:hypothetical protein
LSSKRKRQRKQRWIRDTGLSTASAEHQRRANVSLVTSLAAGDVSVEPDSGIIRGASVLTVGPATGHGFEIDERSLDSLIKAFQANASQVKSRVTHPERQLQDGITYLVGRPFNLRKDTSGGQQVRADIQLFESARQSPQGDLKAWLLSFAQEAPSMFGLSIVADLMLEEQIDPSTGEETGDPIARVQFLKAIDFVDDPAANRNGLLATDNHDSFSGGDAMNRKIRRFLAAKGLIHDAKQATDQQCREALAKLQGTDAQVGHVLSCAQLDDKAQLDTNSTGLLRALNRDPEQPENELEQSDQGTAGQGTEGEGNQPADPQASAEPSVQPAQRSGQGQPAGQQTGQTDPSPAQPAAASAQPDPQQAALAERQRYSQLHGIAQTFNLSREWVDHHFTQGTSLQNARNAAMEAFATQMQPTGVGSPGQSPRVSGGDDGRQSLTAGMVDAVCLRAGMSFGQNEQPHERAREFRGCTLMEMADRWMSQLGVDTTGMERTERAKLAMNPSKLSAYVGDVALAHSTGDFPNILANALRKRMRDQYEAQPRTWDMWARSTTAPDFKEIKRPVLGGIPTPPQVREGAEYTYATVGEAQEAYTLVKHGTLIAFTWEMLINDDMTAFTRQALGFVAAARLLEDDLVYAQLTDNPTLNETGRSVFNTTDNTLASSGSDITVASVGSARARMAKQRGIAPDSQQSGRRLNLQPRHMLVPSEQQTDAEQFINSTVDPSKSNATPNPFQNQLQVVGEPRLSDDSTTAWYLAADPNQVDTVEIAFLEGEPRPMLDEWEGKQVDGRTFKMRHTCAAKVLDYRGLQKDPGA